jgi:hypothetical protein
MLPSLIRQYLELGLEKDKNELIRYNFLKIMGDSVLKSSDVDQAIIHIKNAVLDPSPRISMLAVDYFFQYLTDNPKVIDEMVYYMSRFFISFNQYVKAEILDKIRTYPKKFPIGLLPLLMRFASDSNMHIRDRALTICTKYITQASNPEIYINAMTELLHNDEVMIRRDVVRVLLQMILENFEKMKKGGLIQVFFQISNDNDVTVLRLLSPNLDRIIGFYNTEKAPQLIKLTGIIYNLVESNDKELIEAVKPSLTVILQKKPKEKSGIVKNLEKFYAKNNSPYIRKLIDGITVK